MSVHPIFITNINLWSSTFQAFFPRRYLSITLLYLYNIMPNITYISCSVWLFCNTIAIHLLKKKNSCDHLSLNTYKSLLRTGSMSRPKNIYTCINKKYFATNYVSCSINSFILVHITFNKTIAQVPIKWYTACPRLFYVHQAWLKMKNIFYNTSYIFIYIYIF